MRLGRKAASCQADIDGNIGFFVSRGPCCIISHRDLRPFCAE